MTILAYALLAWLAAASLATFGWVIFVEACRHHQRHNMSGSARVAPVTRRPACPADPGNSSNRAERQEPARYQSGSAHPALRPGAARGTAHASARTEPDTNIPRP